MLRAVFKDARGYEDVDIFTPLEEALSSGSLDPAKIMSGGTPITSRNGVSSVPAALSLLSLSPAFARNG